MTELHDRQAQITFSYLLSIRDGNNAVDLSRIDGYIPILAPVLARHVREVCVPNKISEGIFETYGTHIHPDALEKISERLVERGWLVKSAEEPSTNAILYTVFDRRCHRVHGVSVLVACIASHRVGVPSKGPATPQWAN